MGIKNFFKVKAPTEQEAEAGMREKMMNKGLMVKQESKNKPSTFSAYSDYANDKFKGKREYAPKGYSRQEKEESEKGRACNGNPYSEGSFESGGSAGNPYGSMASTTTSGNPYGSQNMSSVGAADPYGTQSTSNGSNGSFQANGGNPYAQQPPTSQPQHQQSQSSGNPYGSQSSTRSYNSARIQNPYRSGGNAQRPEQDEFTFAPALEKTQTNQSTRTQRTYVPGQQQQLLQEEEDLNDTTYAEEDLNDNGYLLDFNQIALQQEEEVHEETEEERLQREEDEDVEKIKGDIRFTKQESVASTRNTLRMAREAEESGKNTMGVLGAQAETIYNTRRNLQLAEAQDKLSKEKIAELDHYNRNILKPGMKNPFTKGRRLRAQEEKIKNERIEFKTQQERQRSELNASTQRAKSAIDDKDGLEESVASKYRREKIREQAKQYQFEADSEDDNMEEEIAENLDESARILGRLKTLAISQGQEVERQNKTLREIEEQTDRLDVNLHVNTAHLHRAR